MTTAQTAADQALSSSVATCAERHRNNSAAGAEFACESIDRTSQFRQHVAANAGLPNAVDSWLIDLGRIGRGELVTTGDSLRGVI